jgi:hypothetical protein
MSDNFQTIVTEAWRKTFTSGQLPAAFVPDDPFSIEDLTQSFSGKKVDICSGDFNAAKGAAKVTLSGVQVHKLSTVTHDSEGGWVGDPLFYPNDALIAFPMFLEVMHITGSFAIAQSCSFAKLIKTKKAHKKGSFTFTSKTGRLLAQASYGTDATGNTYVSVTRVTANFEKSDIDWKETDSSKKEVAVGYLIIRNDGDLQDMFRAYMDSLIPGDVCNKLAGIINAEIKNVLGAG